MNLFRNPSEINQPKENPVNVPWQSVDIISSNCPVHTGVRLSRLSDGVYKCPEGKEVYKVKGSVSNQTSKDNHYLGFSLK